MESNNPRKLSTFAGVFTPNILSILGVILFLRMGFVVGNAGLWQALLILTFCHVVSILTTFSLSAIATNMSKVKGGGAYYLISQSIGIGNGGAIGVILYLAQTTSIAMYIIGFVDVIIAIFPVAAEFNKIIALGVLGVLFFPTFKGADIASRVQMFIMAILSFSLLVFFVSGLYKFDPMILKVNLNSAYQPGYNFWLIFALFFPAVTGFTQGVSLSGVLKNPQKSIPLGTFLSVILGFFIYAFGMYLLASSATTKELVTDYNILHSLAILPFAITFGVMSATLSSALGSFMGAPHILHAIVKDELFPFLNKFAFIDKSKESSEPKSTVVITMGIAAVCIVLADLNTIAPIVTMFFLLSYGMTNYATFIEAYSQNPSYRPTFKFNHWILSLSGVILIGFAMVMIDFVSAIVALIVLSILQYYLNRKNYGSRFCDARAGFYFQRSKEYLIKLQEQPVEFKNWRPQILLLSGNPNNRQYLVEFGKLIEAKRGALTLLRLVLSAEEDPQKVMKMKKKAETELFDYIKQNHIAMLGDVAVVDNYLNSMKTILQTYGFHGFKPNTLLLGWSNRENQEKGDYLELIRFAFRMRKSIIIFSGQMEYLTLDKGVVHTIDVWWRGKENGPLMLMFAYLMIQCKKYHSDKIRLLRIENDSANVDNARSEMEKLVLDSRIPAEITILSCSKGNTQKTIIDHSKNSDIVFIGLSFLSGSKDFLEAYIPYKEAFKNLAIVRSWERIGILE